MIRRFSMTIFTSHTVWFYLLLINGKPGKDPVKLGPVSHHTWIKFRISSTVLMCVPASRWLDKTLKYSAVQMIRNLNGCCNLDVFTSCPFVLKAWKRTQDGLFMYSHFSSIEVRTWRSFLLFFFLFSDPVVLCENIYMQHSGSGLH